ncbi:hypothetical protein NW851_01905 [Synechococcus sp. H55.7]|uniref:hypothetical protein n=1 Tax=unclassified Synechococcus TaxID=2626047 RepID=UPI0039C3C64F
MSGLDTSAARGRRSPWVWSGQARQADSLFDELFGDLEHSLEAEGAEEYPYLGTRPPLLSRRSSAGGGLLLGLALAATLVAGLAFWMTLRPRSGVFSQADPPRQRDPDLVEALGPAYSASLPAQEPSSASEEEGRLDLPEKVISQEPSGEVVAKPAARTIPAAAASAPPAARRSAPPARIPPQPPPQMKLVGLIHDPGAPKALILVDNVVRQVPVGQAVKGEWRVISISPYGVGVSNGVRSVTLQLGLSQRI